MKIETIKVSALTEYENNSRTHSETQVQQIADSIKEFGFTNPILIDNDNEIIAGHGRYRAALLLGLKDVPCIRLGHLSPRQRRAYVIGDNRLALGSGWDFEKLSAELDALVGLDFDISVLGFNEQEIDSLLKSDHGLFPDEPATVEVKGYERRKHADEETETPTQRCNPGDKWVLGESIIEIGQDAAFASVVEAAINKWERLTKQTATLCS